jgi:hypothetical protein
VPAMVPGDIVFGADELGDDVEFFALIYFSATSRFYMPSRSSCFLLRASSPGMGESNGGSSFIEGVHRGWLSLYNHCFCFPGAGKSYNKWNVISCSTCF